MKLLFKRILTVLLIISQLIIPISVKAAAPSVSALAYVLMDAVTGDVLASKNADKNLSMASTTKILTALLLMEAEEPDTAIQITPQMVNVEGSSMGLRAGYTVKRSDLYYGLMLSSGNDAANVTAFHMAGSLENFSVMMNNKAKEIGLKNSGFVTPSGLDAENHFTTAYDMAVLTKYALKNPTFCRVAATQSITLYYAGGYHTLTNHNKLLRIYDGCIGVKTGFTSKSGRCLVSAAQRNGQTLICVTLNDPNDWNDHISLLDYGFSRSKQVTVSPQIPSTAPIVGGCEQKVKLRALDVEISVFEERKNDINCKINIPSILYAPIEIGQTVGTVDIFIGEAKVSSVNIITVTGSDYAVPVKEKRTVLDCLKKIIVY